MKFDTGMTEAGWYVQLEHPDDQSAGIKFRTGYDYDNAELRNSLTPSEARALGKALESMADTAGAMTSTGRHGRVLPRSNSLGT